jgi:hypothetical protein
LRLRRVARFGQAGFAGRRSHARLSVSVSLWCGSVARLQRDGVTAFLGELRG